MEAAVILSHVFIQGLGGVWEAGWREERMKLPVFTSCVDQFSIHTVWLLLSVEMQGAVGGVWTGSHPAYLGRQFLHQRRPGSFKFCNLLCLLPWQLRFVVHMWFHVSQYLFIPRLFQKTVLPVSFGRHTVFSYVFSCEFSSLRSFL